MPTVLETAKDATYAAVGLNVLFLDEVNERITEQRSQVEERFADRRSQVEEQLDIAREHGQKARERVQPLARRTWEAYESAVMRISELAPAPVDGYVAEGLERVRGFMPEEVTAPAKPAAKKAPAKKAAAKKAPAKKAAAKK